MWNILNIYKTYYLSFRIFPFSNLCTFQNGSVFFCKNEIRGKPKSGRVWKTVKKRFSSNNKVKPLKSTWTEKVQKRTELKETKEHARLLKETRSKELREKRERQEENARRRKENEKKAEIVQKIKNTRKLKRMSKKQLRQIEKR